MVCTGGHGGTSRGRGASRESGGREEKIEQAMDEQIEDNSQLVFAVDSPPSSPLLLSRGAGRCSNERTIIPERYIFILVS